jgi:hypothetical protein
VRFTFGVLACVILLLIATEPASVFAKVSASDTNSEFICRLYPLEAAAVFCHLDSRSKAFFGPGDCVVHCSLTSDAGLSSRSPI